MPSGTNVSGTCTQPMSMAQTPQQYILPSAFQCPPFMGNVTPVNTNSPTYLQSSANTQNDSVLQTMLSTIETIEQKMGQLGEIHTSVNKVTDRLDAMDKRLTEIEHSQQFIHVSDQHESLSTATAANKSDIQHVQSDVKRLYDENAKLKSANESLLDDAIDLKCRSMRDNLLFFGVPKPCINNNPLWREQSGKNQYACERGN